MNLQLSDLESRNPVCLACHHLKAKAMENEYLIDAWNHLCLVDDQPGDGIGSIIGQRPVGCAIQIADGHGTINQKLIVIGTFDELFSVSIKFIGDLTDDLFKNILKRDEPLKRAIFVHHQCKMRAHA